MREDSGDRLPSSAAYIGDLEAWGIVGYTGVKQVAVVGLLNLVVLKVESFWVSGEGECGGIGI